MHSLLLNEIMKSLILKRDVAFSVMRECFINYIRLSEMFESFDHHGNQRITQKCCRYGHTSFFPLPKYTYNIQATSFLLNLKWFYHNSVYLLIHSLYKCKDSQPRNLSQNVNIYKCEHIICLLIWTKWTVMLSKQDSPCLTKGWQIIHKFSILLKLFCKTLAQKTLAVTLHKKIYTLVWKSVKGKFSFFLFNY